MAVSYKGITIKFGGDTTELQGALKRVQSAARETQGDLKDINNALKLDPGNTTLLEQKVKALNSAYGETKSKLDAYKQALSQLEAKKQSGAQLTEQEERQYDTLQRSIMKCERQLESYGDDLKSTAKEAEASKTSLYQFGQTIENNADKFEKAGKGLETAGKTIVGGAVGATTALVGLATSQEENIQQSHQLETAWLNAGGTAEQAQGVYASFYRLLGETDTATEASQNLARLTTSEQELASWTDIAAGAYATFGDALPLENLAEASQETAHTGTVTGGLADALNWSTESAETWSAALSGHADAQSAFNAALAEGGTKEDAFNAALAACGDEQERASVITETLNGLYGEAGKAYQDNNKSLLDSRDAQNELNQAMTDAGEAALPVKEQVTQLGAKLLEAVVPAMQSASEWFQNLTPEQKELATNVGLGVVAFGGLATGVGKLVGAIPGFANGIKTASTAFSAFNGVLKANPILAVVGLVAMIVTALVTFFTQTEEGRQMWSGFCEGMQKAWQGVCDFFAPAAEFFGGIWASVTTGAEGFGSDLAQKWEGIKTGASQAWEGVKGFITSNIDSAKNIGSSASSVFKDALTGDWSALASDSRRLFGDVDNAITSNLQAAKDSGIPIVSDLASGALDKWNWLKTDGVAAFGDLASGISSKLEQAKSWANDKAQGIVDFWQSIPGNIVSFFTGIGDRISSAFGSIHFPSPHVEWGSIQIGGASIPLPTVNWYAGGGYFDRASIIGVGEAGGEYVLPENRITDLMATAIDKARGWSQQVVSVAVTVNASIKDGRDAYATGQQIGNGIASKLKQRGVPVAT